MKKKYDTFLGVPILGDLNEGSSRADQYTQAQLAPILQRLLDDPYIVEFGWDQYTPYFMDGDPCEFGTHGFWVRTQDDLDVEDTEELLMDSDHRSLGSRSWRNNRQYEGTRESQWDMCHEAANAIEGGHFENVLLELFGDHAQVKVARTGITVDFYHHD